MKETTEKILRKKNPIILIVDDVPRNIQVLGTLLKKTDCELAVATSGQQALDTVARIKPDLILLDIMMPGMDGFEVCRKLKASIETNDIPVIFLSAKNETADMIKGYELGAVDYITKPVTGIELLTRVKTHLDFKEAKEKLKEEMVARDKFFSIISHDLHSSFGIILSFVQLLANNRNNLSDQEIGEFLGDIESTTKNSLELLENLLEWARTQSGGIRFNPVKLNLGKLVQEILKSAGDIAGNKKIQITSTVNSQSIVADRNMLLLIIRNLVSNAIKFTPVGGQISIFSDMVDSSIKISVADNGVGIDQNKIEQLFRIDHKVSTPGTQNELGNGLGLILCQEFIQQHGGEIGIDSSPEKGTTVWFTLPLKKDFNLN
ncbi:MAG: hybrid sensor histidine kinase/response regulator [Mariniphaga sp.]|jgi:signal transduction histidine kinase|nr:hybrid sensor histidine kinase/response regulator [Mariniphaga sp.]